MAEGLKADEFETWVPAREALQGVANAVGDFGAASKAIIDRLDAGLLRSHARHGFIEAHGRRASLGEFPGIDERVIKAWKKSDHQSYLGFWKTNQAEQDVSDGYRLDGPKTTFKYFDIRFDQEEIQSLLPQQPKPRLQSDPIEAQPNIVDPVQSGPPVSLALLREWYEIYKKAYPGPEATEDHAWGSARGMFLGKSVTRKAIRDLRGAQKPGPKGSCAR